MSSSESSLSQRAHELRRDFDNAFSAPPIVARTATIDLLAVRAGMNKHAIRLSEIAGLYTDKKITRVPGSNPAMIGIAGFRGSIAPVYDFASLMGYSRSQTPRCMVLMTAASVAFAFEAFGGQLRVSPELIRPRQSGDRALSYTREMVQVEGDLVAIVELGALMTTIKT